MHDQNRRPLQGSWLRNWRLCFQVRHPLRRWPQLQGLGRLRDCGLVSHNAPIETARHEVKEPHSHHAEHQRCTPSMRICNDDCVMRKLHNAFEGKSLGHAAEFLHPTNAWVQDLWSIKQSAALQSFKRILPPTIVNGDGFHRKALLSEFIMFL